MLLCNCAARCVTIIGQHKAGVSIIRICEVRGAQETQGVSSTGTRLLTQGSVYKADNVVKVYQGVREGGETTHFYTVTQYVHYLL